MATEFSFCVGDYVVSNQTLPHKPLKKDGKFYKKEGWCEIAHSPSRVIKIDETGMILNSFCSDPDSIFKVNESEYSRFKKVEIEDGYLQLELYENFHISEFEKRRELQNFMTEIRSLNLQAHPELNNLIMEKLPQMKLSQGSEECITIQTYMDYKDGKKTLTALEDIGHPIFNRTCRWAPPIDISPKEFKQSPSYPAPLGVRPKDFCFPSELIETIKELLIQIANFENVTSKSFSKLQKKFPFIHKKNHCCKYCGESIDLLKCKGEYKSQKNFIEICHRDPNDRFLTHNVYWGHGECNRRQGGYTEKERIFDGLRLALIDPTQISPESREMIKELFKLL